MGTYGELWGVVFGACDCLWREFNDKILLRTTTIKYMLLFYDEHTIFVIYTKTSFAITFHNYFLLFHFFIFVRFRVVFSGSKPGVLG